MIYCYSKLLVTNYPKFLFITLKENNNLMNKIDINININLTYKFGKSSEYNLIGFIVHIGSFLWRTLCFLY